MLYDELNDIVLSTSDKIEQKIGRDLSNTEKYALNDKMTEFLQDIDVEVNE
jgi:hypothetical protein